MAWFVLPSYALAVAATSVNRAKRTLAANTRARRLEIGLTQEATAEAMRIDFRRYQRLESGEVNATLLTLSRLAETLKTDISRLFAKA